MVYSSTPTILAAFDGPNGAFPLYGALVADANGDLFGTTGGDGVDNDGTVFEIAKTAAGYGSLTTLASFNYMNGDKPQAGLSLDAAGDLFGTTSYGGPSSGGTVFEIAKTSSGYASPTILASFGGTGGNSGLVADAAGDLFGVTQAGTIQGGGGGAYGAVFEIAKTASGFGPATAIYTFTSPTTLAVPQGDLTVDSAGDLFGVTLEGGANQAGAVFEIAKTASGYAAPQILASFSAFGNSGASANGDLIMDAAGDLFGTTHGNGGAVFEIAKTSAGYGPLVTLAQFNAAGAYGPLGGLVMDHAGDLFGTTQLGNGDSGSVYEIVKTGSSYGAPIALYDFVTGGAEPFAGLTFDAAGDLIGTTSAGGPTAGDEGEVFELSASFVETATVDATTTVLDSDPVAAPTIAGAVAGQTTTSEAPLKPFSSVTIGDRNPGATDILSITVGGAGGALSGSGLVSLGHNRYTLTATPTTLTQELEALSFQPVSGGSGARLTSTFSLQDASSYGTDVSDDTTTVIDIDPAVPPTISGAVAGQVTNNQTPLAPFAHVTIEDQNVGATESLTIAVSGSGGTLSGAGLTEIGAGQYALSGSAATVSNEIEAVQFTPNGGAPNSVLTSDFSLNDASSAGPMTVDDATTVIDRPAAVAPTIGGVVAVQATTSEIPIAAFASVTVGDTNAGATDTLTITLSGSGGALSGSGLVAKGSGVYTLSGTAAAITAALDKLAFTPSAEPPGQSAMTSFALSDVSSVGMSAADDATTVTDSYALADNWTSGVSANWSDASAWSDGAPPNDYQQAVIGGDASEAVTVVTAAEAESVSMTDPSAQVQLEADLTTAGAIDVAGELYVGGSQSSEPIVVTAGAGVTIASGGVYDDFNSASSANQIVGNVVNDSRGDDRFAGGLVAGGELQITGSLTGAGVTVVESGLEVGGPVSQSIAIQSGARLKLDDPAAFSGSLAMTAGVLGATSPSSTEPAASVLDLAGIGAATASYDDGVLSVVEAAGPTLTLDMSAATGSVSLDDAAVQTASDSDRGTEVYFQVGLDQTWAAGVSGYWSEGAFWASGVAPGPYDTAVFASSDNETVTVLGGQNLTVSQIVVTDPHATFDIAGSLTATQSVALAGNAVDLSGSLGLGAGQLDDATVTLDGGSIFYPYENAANVGLGFGDPNLTLGAGLVLDVIASSAIDGAFSYVNSGQISVTSDLVVAPNSAFDTGYGGPAVTTFTNNGVIEVASGGALTANLLLQNTGTLTLEAGASATFANFIFGFNAGGASIPSWSNTGAITLGAGAKLTLSGDYSSAEVASIDYSGATLALDGAPTDDGDVTTGGDFTTAGGDNVITAEGGTLVLDVPVQLAPALAAQQVITSGAEFAIGAGATLEITADASDYGYGGVNPATPSGPIDTINPSIVGTINFDAPSGTLQLDRLDAFAGFLTGVQAGDRIDFAGADVTKASIYIGSNNDDILTVTTATSQTMAWGINEYLPSGDLALDSDKAGGTSLTFMPNTTPPTVVDASAAVDNGATDIGAGHAVTITLNMSEPVAVTGAPTLELDDGGVATYVSGSGASALTFTYQTQSNQNTPDLAIAGVDFSQGTIEDLAGNPLSATLAANLGIQVDTQTPVVVKVSAPPATVASGQREQITVSFSEAVSVSSGAPILHLDNGGEASYDAAATAALGDPASLVFDYTVGGLDLSEAAPKIVGVDLDGATVADAAGNDADLSQAIGESLDFSVDTSTASPGAGPVYFIADDGLGSQVWDSNGLASGTLKVVATDGAYASPADLTATSNAVYFVAGDAAGNSGLFQISGSQATEIQSFQSGSFGNGGPGDGGPGEGGGAISEFVDSIAADGDQLFYTEDQMFTESGSPGAGTATVTLYVANGTSPPTQVENFYAPGGQTVSPDLTVANGRVYFIAPDNFGQNAVWSSDGTTNSAYELPEGYNDQNGQFIPVFGPATSLSLSGQYLTINYGGQTLVYDTQSQQMISPYSGGGTAAAVLRLGGDAYTANGGLVKTDAAGDQSVIGNGVFYNPANLTVSGDTLYFTATDFKTGETAVWSTHGTDATTTELTTPDGALSNFSNFTAVDGKLFFTASDPATGADRLFVSDGTAAGTLELAPSAAIPDNPQNLVADGSTLFFSATDPVDGTQLWSSDGSPAGTHLVDNGAADPGSLVVGPAYTSKAVDGYIAGAEVFADANGNGVFDPGEAETTTDAEGNFTLTGGSGPLVLTGGLDTITGLPNTTTYTAPAGATVVTPLTTLVQTVAASAGVSVAAAEATVAQAFDLPGATSLTTLDPVADAFSGDAAVYTAGVEAADAISLVSAALGNSASTGNGVTTQAAATSALASLVASAASPIDLGDPTTIASVIEAAETDSGRTLSADAASAVATVVAASNQDLQTLAQTAATPTQALLDGGSVEYVAQGQTLSNINANVAPSSLVADNTGAALTSAVTSAAADVTAPTPCYVRGARILNARGEVAVEDLAIGDVAITASGAWLPIVWLGHRALDLARHPDPEAVRPVRVRANAFGEGLPRRDLWLSPEHAVYVEEKLIPIGQLVNGATIAQQPVDHVEYWHVELESHDVLLAEGLPAESYLDCGNRRGFDNAPGDVVALHPDWRARAQGRRFASPRVVARWREALAARAVDLGRSAALEAYAAKRRARAGAARTNFVRNPRGEGCVAGRLGAGGEGPRGWRLAAPEGVVIEISGAGEEAGLPFVDIRFHGRPSAAGHGCVYPEPGAAIAARAGQDWTASCYLRLVDGALDGVEAVSLYIDEMSAHGAYLSGAPYLQAWPCADALDLQRASATRRLLRREAAAMTAYLQLAMAAQAPLDLTLRLAAFQFEQGRYASDPILPPAGAPDIATRRWAEETAPARVEAA